ncbi:MAG: thioredoxin [Alphaproteobacteria bacterium]
MDPTTDAMPTPATALIKDSGSATFAADVIEASKEVPVIVDFWAPWCGPCKQLGPALEKLVNEAAGAVRLVKINIDEHPAIAQQLRIQSIPAVFAFKDGRPVDGFAGALPDSELKQFIDKLTDGTVAPSPVAGLLEAAKAALTAKDSTQATALFSEALTLEPGNVEAIVGLARCYLDEGEIDMAREIIDGLSDELAAHAEVASLRSALELVDMRNNAGDAEELARKVAANPKDLQARFDLAMARYAADDREAAIDELLEIVRRDRSWNESAARKQLLKFFEVFGSDDPLTQTGRRRLSSMLFS